MRIRSSTRRDGVATRHRLAGGPPFCLVEYDYPVETLKLGAGEPLVLVTDGITEAQDAHGALYGRDHILEGLALGDGSATAICEAIRDDVRRFEQGTEATDDLTVMVLRYLGADVPPSGVSGRSPRRAGWPHC